jgi:hypothetical protein
MIGAKSFLLFDDLLLFVVLDCALAAPLFDADFTALYSFHDYLRNAFLSPLPLHLIVGASEYGHRRLL